MSVLSSKQIGDASNPPITAGLLFLTLGSLVLGSWTVDQYWGYRESWAYPREVLQRISVILTAGTCCTLLLCGISIASGIRTVQKLVRWGGEGKLVFVCFTLTLVITNLMVVIFFAIWTTHAIANGWFPDDSWLREEQSL